MTDEKAFKEIQQLILDAGAEKHSLSLQVQELQIQNSKLYTLLEEAERQRDYFKKMATEKPFQLIKGGKKAK